VSNGKLLYGWGGAEWVKLRCDALGNILVDSSELTFDVLKLNPQAVAPAVIEGGVYYNDVTKSFYGGFD